MENRPLPLKFGLVRIVFIAHFTGKKKWWIEKLGPLARLAETLVLSASGMGPVLRRCSGYSLQDDNRIATREVVAGWFWFVM